MSKRIEDVVREIERMLVWKKVITLGELEITEEIIEEIIEEAGFTISNGEIEETSSEIYPVAEQYVKDNKESLKEKQRQRKSKEQDAKEACRWENFKNKARKNKKIRKILGAWCYDERGLMGLNIIDILVCFSKFNKSIKELRRRYKIDPKCLRIERDNAVEDKKHLIDECWDHIIEGESFRKECRRRAGGSVEQLEKEFAEIRSVQTKIKRFEDRKLPNIDYDIDNLLEEFDLHPLYHTPIKVYVIYGEIIATYFLPTFLGLEKALGGTGRKKPLKMYQWFIQTKNPKNKVEQLVYLTLREDGYSHSEINLFLKWLGFRQYSPQYGSMIIKRFREKFGLHN